MSMGYVGKLALMDLHGNYRLRMSEDKYLLSLPDGEWVADWSIDGSFSAHRAQHVPDSGEVGFVETDRLLKQ